MQKLDKLSLTQEANNARQLAEAGLQLLQSMKDPHYDSAGMFACLGLAAEKLTKIAFGLGTHNLTGKWPAGEIKNFVHKIDELEPISQQFIANYLEINSKKSMSLWVSAVETHSWLPELFAILRNYGSGGRFYYLDTVGGDSRFPAPEDQWMELEEKVVRGPDVIPVAHLEAFLDRRNKLIAQGYRDWWTMYESAMIHGAFGELGTQLSASISLSSCADGTGAYLITRGRELTRTSI